MSRAGCRRFAMVLSAVLVLALSVLPTVFATEDMSFSLSDATASKGRLFEVTLVARGGCTLGAFAAELRYDPSLIEYRDADCLYENAENKVSIDESGKLTSVFIAKEGIPCDESPQLATFSFMALAEGTSDISLSVSDVIDIDSKMSEVVSCNDSKITVTSAAKGKTYAGSKSEKETYITEEAVTEAEPADREEFEAKRLFADSPETGLIVAVCVGTVAVICAFVFVAYKFGARNQRQKDKHPVPLEKEEVSQNQKSKQEKAR